VTAVEDIAAWVAGLSAPDVPADVLDLCRDQRRSVLGAVAASSGDAAARRILDAVDGWAAGGPVGVAALGRAVSVDDALYATTALSMALDFDDYVCFGHTGHSAVLVPVLLAAETGSPGVEQLLSQVAANEVEARLGGACLIGPQNGQLWSFIHAAGAALGAGRLLGLDAGRLAHALAIALYQPPRATVPGFMAPDSKLLTAAEPALAGLRAARLAAAGVTGPLDALEHPDGFLGAFADAPLPGMLSGLGQAWATRTLCVKPYPGCAYLDTTVDALLELGPPKAEEVERVIVEASVLTCEMDRMSRRYAAHGTPTPVTINFSVAWNVAATLLGGELTPRQTETSWLADHEHDLRALASKVELRHDWGLTRLATDSFAGLVPPGRVARDAGLGRLRRSAGRLRSRGGGSGGAGVRDLKGISQLFWPLPDRRTLARSRPFWDPEAVDGFAMTFPARVRVQRANGHEDVATVATPRGAAGHTSVGPPEVSRAKLAAWGPLMWGEDGTAALAAAVDGDADGLHSLI
jgi:2-methylcitrate dehydratase PrpD